MSISLSRDELEMLLEQLEYSHKQINTDMCSAYDQGQTIEFMRHGRALDNNLDLTEIFKVMLEETK